jgi:hypothetical protein
LPPRLPHVALATEPYHDPPYVQLLNTSAWLLYDADVDPERSQPEFLAYLLAHGDRMAASGEVTLAALHTAAWWLERSDDECDAFTAAAARGRPSGRRRVPGARRRAPVAACAPHETLRPPTTGEAAPRDPRQRPPRAGRARGRPPALAARWNGRRAARRRGVSRERGVGRTRRRSTRSPTGSPPTPRRSS